MVRRYTPTANDLRRLFNYDPDTGLFTNLVSRGPRCLVGNVAGSYHREGYIEIMIYGFHFKASRLAYLYMTGEWPRNEMDHINGIKDDNRWCNLRDVTPQVNCSTRGGKFAIARAEG